MVVQAASPSQRVSIHAAREGGDGEPSGDSNACNWFQSTPPARAATRPHGSCRGSRLVSIHAAREGGDGATTCKVAGGQCFNPRRPRGRRHLPKMYGTPAYQFQSTPPARAATPRFDGLRHGRAGFNPRRPRGRRPPQDALTMVPLPFQSTPPARAATSRTRRISLPTYMFQSTPPARAATLPQRLHQRAFHRFNPRRPRGRRQPRTSRSHWRIYVSIHAAREGGDVVSFWSRDAARLFQSTPPARAAT